MLSKYTFKNFFSFRDETSVSFDVSGHVPERHSICFNDVGARLSKVIAVVGPNASGKTNLLKPLVFIQWFIGHSFRQEPDSDIPLQGHMLALDEPSEFEAEFDFNGASWRYRLIATRKRVLHESLHTKTSRLFSYVFVRDWDSSTREYIIKQQGFGFTLREARKVRENASLISTAAQYGVELAGNLSQVMLSSNIDFMGRIFSPMDRFYQLSELTKFFKEQDVFRKKALSLLKKWDIGLSDVSFQEVAPDPSKPDEKVDVMLGHHESKNGRFSLSLLQESSGTQGALLLLSKLLPVLEYGGMAVIDELEADLHPHMLEPILELFFNTHTNPHNAQLIFTCHAAEVLNLLHKSQIVLVEKDENHSSQAWRLDSVLGVRADDNLYAKYMAGAYSAIPDIQ